MRLVVIRRLDDHLVRADAVHPIEQPLPFAIEIALDLQRGKPVRHDAQIPARRVRRAAVLPERADLGRRHVLATGTERTVLAGDDLGALELEVGGPLLAIGGNDHPAAGDRILAELRQWEGPSSNLQWGIYNEQCSEITEITIPTRRRHSETVRSAARPRRAESRRRRSGRGARRSCCAPGNPWPP